MSDLEPVAPTEPAVAEEPEVFWTFGDLLLALALAGPAFFVALGIVHSVILITGFQAPTDAFKLLPSQFLGYGLWFAAVWALLKLRYQRPLWHAMRWHLPGRAIAPAILKGIGLAFGIMALGVILRTPQIDSPMEEMLKHRASLLLVGAFAVTLGPICEELMFRGFLQPLLVRSLGTLAGIGIAALGFGLLHGAQYGWSWRHVLSIGLAGAAFGWRRHTTGSTADAALMHAAYNAVLFIGLLLTKGD